MQHDIQVDGSAFRLRPITINDAELIIKLRTSQSDRTKYLHPISNDLDVQKKYLTAYFDRPNDYYFVLERLKNNTAEGLISVYDVDPDLNRAEWGRWVLRDRSLGATESCWLIYQVIFDKLNLEQAYCRTVAENHSVVSFHDSCGLNQSDIISNHFELNGQTCDAIEHTIFRDQWTDIDRNLNQKSQLIANRLNR